MHSSAREHRSGDGARSGEGEGARASVYDRDALLAAICHDLRAPLAAVMMGANFVLQTTPEAPTSVRSRRVLEAMLRSCKQMERLVRDFGDLAEIEGGSLVLRRVACDGRQLLEVALEAARPNAAARNITLELSGTEPAHLECDRDRLLRALGHLVDNAVRFGPEGSTVTLRATVEGAFVRLAVTDHGPGLSEETLANLYDRAWHAARAGRAGAGLGIAIARGLVLAHGGSIEVVSTPNNATTFSLLLPREAVTKPRTKPA
jgi:signal transduction histidine kinase